VGLLTVHKGEVLEMSPTHNEWLLTEGPLPESREVLRYWDKQFFCLELRKPEGKDKKRDRQSLTPIPQCIGHDREKVNPWEYGQTPPWNRKIAEQVDGTTLTLDSTLKPEDLRPDWDNQVLRCAVPCKNNSSFHWRRVCHCITRLACWANISMPMFFTISTERGGL
jgi:hypothetical protein